MSGYLRFCFAGLVLVGGLAATPAVSDPFADLFNAAPREPAATSLAQAQCLPRPGNSTAEGQHWVYRMDGHRKCWFQAEGITTIKKPFRRRPARDQVAGLDHDTAARRGKAVADRRAELLRSAPAEAAQPPHASEIKVADAGSILDASRAALLSGTPILDPSTGHDWSNQTAPQVAVEKSLPATSDAATISVSPPMPVSLSLPEENDPGGPPAATWLGMLLMALGVVSVLSSSRALREAVVLRH